MVGCHYPGISIREESDIVIKYLQKGEQVIGFVTAVVVVVVVVVVVFVVVVVVVVYLRRPRLLLELGEPFLNELLIDMYVLLCAGVVQINAKNISVQRVHLQTQHNKGNVPCFAVMSDEQS